ncbi:MAG: type IV toxin-antitoxin system AbiEi family antitoxin domain-containing protein [Solirubrobacterales bacterium]
MGNVGAVLHLCRGKALPFAIGELASRQYGVVARWQLVALGASERMIDGWTANGWLVRIHPGVYVLGYRRLTRKGDWTAAVLACGGGALLARQSAGSCWGVTADSRAIHVLAGRAGSAHRGVIQHRTRSLHPDDRTIRDGIPVTSWARTMLDLAEVLTPHRLERALDESEFLRLFDLTALHAVIERSPGRKGRKPLTALLAKWDHASPTKSELEERFLQLCADYDLPKPHTNTTVCDFDVDAHFRDAKLVVELDDGAAHLTRSRFESDRVRDAKLQIAGYRVVRITWRRLRDEPTAVAADLRALLRAPTPVAT